jgi:hypothetical protein
LLQSNEGKTCFSWLNKEALGIEPISRRTKLSGSPVLNRNKHNRLGDRLLPTDSIDDELLSDRDTPAKKNTEDVSLGCLLFWVSNLLVLRSRHQRPPRSSQAFHLQRRPTKEALLTQRY